MALASFDTIATLGKLLKTKFLDVEAVRSSTTFYLTIKYLTWFFKFRRWNLLNSLQGKAQRRWRRLRT